MLTRKDKEKYRASKEWKEFREQMKKRQKCCALCGVPLRGKWNLHHVKNCLTLEEYTSKNKNDFLCLCNQWPKLTLIISRPKNKNPVPMMILPDNFHFL